MKNNRTTERMLEASREIWEGYLQHPFLFGLADGSLDQEKFRFYLLQDYLYLFEYAKVFAHGLVKTNDPAVMQMFAGYIDQILNGELEIHRGYMQRFGISAEQAQREKPALRNRSYTAYMRAVSAEGGAAEALAAVLSCALSYEYIAKKIMETHPQAADHAFYGEWVRGYASEEYAAANQELIVWMEKLTKQADEEQLARLVQIFVDCSRYEAMFWDMAWDMEL